MGGFVHVLLVLALVLGTISLVRVRTLSRILHCRLRPALSGCRSIEIALQRLQLCVPAKAPSDAAFESRNPETPSVRPVVVDVCPSTPTLAPWPSRVCNVTSPRTPILSMLPPITPIPTVVLLTPRTPVALPSVTVGPIHRLRRR